MPLPSHYRAAAERVYRALFEDGSEFQYVAAQLDCQHLADQLTRVFRQSMIERIEAALRGEKDPLRRVVNEARARKKE